MISTRGRYALRVMIDLAENGGGCVPLKEIAERQKLSKKYLEILMKDMVTGGLLTGTSGKGGGYRLVRRPEEYSVGEILELMEGSLSAVSCLAGGAPQCPRATECETLPLWMEYDKLTHDFFYGKRLTDLMKKPEACCAWERKPEMLTLERARELNDSQVTEEHLRLHAKNVMYAMGAMAEHFGEDREHWMAVGYLHDYDYEKYPDEHLQHTAQPLLDAGVPEEDVRAILSHGYGICTDVEPVSNLEKSLFTVDELTGIIQACARMRPNGIADLEVKSFLKKFKDRKFAAKCDRDLIGRGCEMLGMEVSQVAAICIEGMKPYAAEIGLLGTGA